MKPVGVTSRKQRGRKTVLVVDDNPGIRRALCRALTSDGFEVCAEAQNGRESLALAKQFNPNLIILDLAMPIMNGLRAAPELRKIVPKTSIILFTLYGAEVSKEDAASMGIDLVASKAESLFEIIKKAHVLVGE